MNRDEILALSGEVVAVKWPDWWNPGQECSNTGLSAQEFDAAGRDKYHCRACGFSVWRAEDGKSNLTLQHEIPPPDLTEAKNFLRALTLCRFAVWQSRLGKCWCSNEYPNTQPIDADTPELALLLALVDYVRRGKEQP